MSLDLPKVVVITATIGTAYLKECIQSVQNQTYPNIEHILVCDGEEHWGKVLTILREMEHTKKIIPMVIPWNSGANRYICHKIYASIPHLLHEPCYVSFLDEDNYYDSNHIEGMMRTLQEKQCQWTYALRKILSKNGTYICRDMCESLGKLSPTWISSSLQPDYLVDTSCYLIPVQILRKFSECWQRPARANPEGDRYFYQCLSQVYTKFECTLQYTVNYRVDGREDSVKQEFFLKGNEVMKQRYPNQKLPWDV